jgi:hypothetical protein
VTAKSLPGRGRARLADDYLDAKGVAEEMGWNTDKARYWLLREGMATKHGGRWYTTRSRLMAAFPEHFEPRGEKTYLDTRDVARLMGWSTDQARYWLKREGAVMKRGGRWYTTESRLRAEFQSTFESLGR